VYPRKLPSLHGLLQYSNLFYAWQEYEAAPTGYRINSLDLRLPCLDPPFLLSSIALGRRSCCCMAQGKLLPQWYYARNKQPECKRDCQPSVQGVLGAAHLPKLLTTLSWQEVIGGCTTLTNVTNFHQLLETFSNCKFHFFSFWPSTNTESQTGRGILRG
jgi:hypothetical protein